MQSMRIAPYCRQEERGRNLKGGRRDPLDEGPALQTGSFGIADSTATLADLRQRRLLPILPESGSCGQLPVMVNALCALARAPLPRAHHFNSLQ